VRQPPTGIRPCDFGIPSPYYSLKLTTEIKSSALLKPRQEKIT
jgi:hypothetical protein